MRALSKQLIIAFCIVVVLVLLYQFVDRPAAHFFQSMQKLSLLRAAIYASLFFNPHLWIILAPLGIVVSGLGGWFQQGLRPWSRRMLYICCSVLLAIIVGTILKVTIGRFRPLMFLQLGMYGFQYFSRTDLMHSMPSGHALVSFALATSCAILCRRHLFWVIVFYAVAVLCCFSRLVTLSHFPSDVVFGAYLGILSAWCMQYFIVKGKR